MVKIGRNAPCPCGTGRKFKKCCLSTDGMAQVDQLLEQRRLAVAEQAALVEALLHTAESFVLENDLLDEISTRVVDLIRERRFDEALALCQQLLLEYPDHIDGLHRSAMVHRVRGDHGLAADFYQRALEFTALPEQCDGFDDEERDHYRAMSGAMRRLAAPGGPDGDELRGPT